MSQAGQFYRAGLISTLTGDVGGAVGPTAGNIDILGGSGLTVTGTPGTSTLTLVTAGLASSFPTDSGAATPALGILNVLGGSNLNTTGAGDTVTVVMDNDVTLSGQLEANQVESITYVTAGTNITAVGGNISAVAGNVSAGGAVNAAGDITSATGDLNAVLGNLDIGGSAAVVGAIVSTSGSITAQVDITAVTGDITASQGDIIATLGSGFFGGGLTIGTGVIITTGDLTVSSGNISASGTVTGGSGLIATAGGVLASAGDITATLGNILTSTGSIDSAATISAVGNITTSTGDFISTLGAVSAATTITSGGNITSTAGNLAVSAGTITASGNILSSSGNVSTSVGVISSGSTITAAGDITTSTGDLVATTGDIRAPLGTLFVGTFSASGDIVTSAGNLIATIGDVIAGDEVTSGGRMIAGSGVTVTSGGILVSGGDIVTAVGSITADSNLVALTGNINAPNGDITAGFDLVAGADISSILGDVTAEMGDVVARYDIESIEGDIIAQGGDILTLAGFIRSAGAVIADVNLKASGTVQFTDITDGGLLADSDGYVSASAGFTDPFTGFATWTGAGAYFDDTVLGSFEVLRGGTGYIKGVPVTWAGSQTVTGMTAGNTYLIYMDDTGTIGKTTSFSLATFEDYIVLFECLRDSTGTNIQYTVKENHPFGFPVETSWWAHETVGTVIENHANGANITLNGTVKIEIVGADELSDHGLYTDIPDGGGTAETWMQMLTNGSGKWFTYQSSDTFNGYWNSGGTATAPSGTKFSVYTLYVSKDDLNAATPTYWAVLDDQEYNSLTAAQTAIALGTPASISAELAQLEMCRLGYIIYKQNTTEIIDVIIDKTTFQSGATLGGGTNQASLVLTDVTNFDGILSAADTTVQSALETIDDWGASTTDHAVLIGNGTGSAIGSLAVGTNGQLLVGSTAADPVFATVASADNSIEVTGGAGTIDLSSTGTIAVNNQTGTTYELVLADRGKIVTCTNAGAITVTIPVNADVALAIGTNVLISQNGAGTVTLAPEGGVTLSSRGALLDTAGQYAIASVTKIDTNVWLVGGDLA